MRPPVGRSLVRSSATPRAGRALSLPVVALALGGCGADGGGGTGGAGPSAGGTTPTEANLRVAFIADQGLGPQAVAVLELIAAEGADFVIHAGDFDYGDDPDGWDTQITDVLGDSYPYFACPGERDVAEWAGYRTKLEERLAKVAGATCAGGELGVDAACTYRGLFFLLSGVGIHGSLDHRAHVEQALAADDSIWRVCTWHANRADFQPGGRGDEVPLETYQACAMGRALIVNGHDQSYARTLTLTDIDNPSAGYRPVGSPAEAQVTVGNTFVIVSGLGGQAQQDYVAADHDDDTWWASIYAGGHYRHEGEISTFFDYDFGALFVDFYVNQDPRLARGYFKTVAGDVVDEFFVHTAASLPEP